uniref:DUF4806 domain-containing protein n=1 Tax=Cacopsylla melanoneura TaxID=428564 RepID=A0A8D8TRR4_9HEMI
MSLFSLSETNSCCLERIKTEPLDDTNDFPAESKNQPDMGVDPLAVVKHESSDPTSDDNNTSQLSEIFEVVKDIYAVVIKVEAEVDGMGTLERKPYESRDILSRLPCQSRSDLEEWETLLEDKAWFTSLESYLATLGGTTARSHVYNMLKTVFSSELGREVSLTGRSILEGKSKKKFEGTNMYRLIADISRKKFKHDNTVVRTCMSDWFNSSNTRVRRQKMN